MAHLELFIRLFWEAQDIIADLFFLVTHSHFKTSMRSSNNPHLAMGAW